MENEIEIWKDVPNYEGHYQVSSLGRVKSLKKYKGTVGHILKPSKNIKGYLYVVLYKNCKEKTFKVHQIVAMAFKGHVPDGTYKIVVDHIDNNPLNNRADNLQLIPQRENCSKDKKGHSSEFVGVFWDRNKWRAAILFKGTIIYLGSFFLEIDASNTYQKAKKEADEGLDLNILYPKGRNKSSIYKGVVWDKSRSKWMARYKNKYIGRFEAEIEAHQAVQNYILKVKLIT